jgi:hypothetical protein
MWRKVSSGHLWREENLPRRTKSESYGLKMEAPDTYKVKSSGNMLNVNIYSVSTT